MTFKKFLLRYILIVVFLVVAALGAAYFDVKRHMTGETAPRTVPVEDLTEEGAAAFKDRPVDKKTGEKVDPYSPEYYPLPYSGSGVLKSVASGNNEILIAGDSKNFRSIITDKTEIFRNGARASLSDIKGTDRIAILGRKKSADGKEFVADSIYANTPDDSPISYAPVATPVELLTDVYVPAATSTDQGLNEVVVPAPDAPLEGSADIGAPVEDRGG